MCTGRAYKFLGKGLLQAQLVDLPLQVLDDVTTRAEVLTVRQCGNLKSAGRPIPPHPLVVHHAGRKVALSAPSAGFPWRATFRAGSGTNRARPS